EFLVLRRRVPDEDERRERDRLAVYATVVDHVGGDALLVHVAVAGMRIPQAGGLAVAGQAIEVLLGQVDREVGGPGGRLHVVHVLVEDGEVLLLAVRPQTVTHRWAHVAVGRNHKIAIGDSGFGRGHRLAFVRNRPRPVISGSCSGVTRPGSAATT